MLLKLVSWLVFLHILGSLIFFLSRGASVAMAFQIRKEKDFTRIEALFDLSASTMGAMGTSFLVMGLTGLAMSFILKIWN